MARVYTTCMYNYTELPYRDHLFSGSSDNTIKMWNSQSLELLASFKGHDDPVCTLACSESFLFSGSLRSIKVQSIELHTRAFLSSCGRGAEGSCSQSVFADVQVWDNQTHKLVKKLPTQNHWIRALVVVGKYLYSGSYKAVKVCNQHVCNMHM